LRCPFCSYDGVPRPSGPYDLADHVTDVLFLVCPGCDRYTSAFSAPQREPVVEAPVLRQAA
jgi:hypothetical protein